jgi:hypothetical protein
MHRAFAACNTLENLRRSWGKSLDGNYRPWHIPGALEDNDLTAKTRPTHQLALFAAALVLAACSNSVNGVRFTNDSTGSSGKPQPEPIHNLTAAEIKAAISGKTFQYTRPDGNGFVTYNADGSFSFQDDAKGGGTGTWAATDGQFCEVFGKGAAQDCGEFKATGDAYFAAKSRLVEMKV